MKENHVLECIRQLLPNIAADRLIAGTATVAGTVGIPVIAGAAVPLTIAAGCVAAYLGLIYLGAKSQEADATKFQSAMNLIHGQAIRSEADLRSQLTVLGFDLSLDLIETRSRLAEIDGLVRLQGKTDEEIVDYLQKHEGLFVSLGRFLEEHFDELRDGGIKVQGSLDALKAAVTDISGELKAIAALARRDPPMSFASPTAHPGSSPFYYGYELFPYAGREAELAELNSFLRSEGSLRWWLLTGTGGAGKNRTALELAHRNQGTWHAGFLSSAPYIDWHIWQPRRPTLIIVDYVAARAEEMGRAIRLLSGRQLSFPVRLLLLERTVSEEWHKKLMGSEDQRAALAATVQSNTPCVLPAANADVLWGIMCQVFQSQGVTPPERVATLAALQRVDPQGTPLFAAFAADALASTGNIRLWDWNRQELLQRVLEKQQNIWEKRGLESSSPVLNLLALATITGGIGVGDPSAWGVLDLVPVLPADRDCPAYVFTGCEGQATRFAPLVPDMLGEFFVLEHIKSRPSLATSLVCGAWELKDARTQDFINRVLSDFRSHPAIEHLMALPTHSPHAWMVWGHLVGNYIGTTPMPADIRTSARLYEKLQQFDDAHPEELVLRTLRIRALVALRSTLIRAGWQSA